MNWTDERVELLKKLWSEGLSASQIATQLGGVSRNAVIGKVHRLKLSGRGRSAPAPAQKAKRPTPTVASSAGVQRSSGRAAPSGMNPVNAVSGGSMRSMPTSIGATALKAQFDATPVPQQQVMRSTEDVVVPISRRLPLVALTERTCKWPNGDPLSDDFNFCGNDCAEAGPYCTYHAKLAFQPTSERRRVR
ncbi:GcrA family cell cycle regulator [Limoniibacter endophyticus]|uniref:GcrA cell cycle regulator n=1 Tax=Limoniibacter endophyticus TaxID=1565040 RepID=A0A8J3DRJ1_9HYPH|nr:GcrA family cell cycle regulator [Limoniibacter endophyticus]GHC80351.1 GcrA cell cycle regulator [Limoniibacter endophyticus]